VGEWLLPQDDRGVIPSLVLADADVGDRFPSAHGSEFGRTDPHVAFAIHKQPLDVIVDLMLDRKV